MKCVLTLVLFVTALTTWANEYSSPPDHRQQRQHDSAAWLYSIGQLQVPTRKWTEGEFQHSWETCSASLTGPSHKRGRYLILTAWHCLEYYTDLSRPIRFVLQTSSGESAHRHARVVADGGGMRSDWAVLSLDQPIATPTISIPIITPKGKALIEAPQSRVTLAGFSRDSGLGENGKKLTFQSNCRVTGGFEPDVALNCRAHKGASGGAAIVVQTSGDVETAYLAGVISQGNGSDTSVVVGSEEFFSALQSSY